MLSIKLMSITGFEMPMKRFLEVDAEGLVVEEDAVQRQTVLSEFSKMLGSVIRLFNLDPNRYKGQL